MTTGIVWDERYMWHDTGSGAGYFSSGPGVEPEPFIEGPAAKRRIRNLLDVSGLLEQLHPIKPIFATDADLGRVHSTDYIDRIRLLSESTGGDAGETTPFGPGSFPIACLAAGGCMAAVDAVCRGVVDNAYALVRPPGHHSEASLGRGFCIFSNLAIAVKYAQEAGLVDRVAVVDWDVHHGNGTQKAFWDDPAVLTISLHQANNYPQETGHIDEVGGAAAAGTNINIPLPPGSGEGAYLSAFERVVLPAVTAHRPDLIMVASGLDSSVMDPLGRMMLTSRSYAKLTSLLVDAARRLCRGRLVMTHEGGYSTYYAPYCGLAIFETLSGVDTPIEDPFLQYLAGFDGQDLQPHQTRAIDALVRDHPLLRVARP